MFIVSLQKSDAESLFFNLKSYLRKYITEGEVITYLPQGHLRHMGVKLAALEAGSILIDFVYDKIVKRKRRAAGQMLQVARIGVRSPDGFRNAIMEYMQESEFSRLVEGSSQSDLPEQWFSVLRAVEGTDGLAKLLGACRRQLEENPSHAGLLILYGICRSALMGQDHDTNDNTLLDIENGFLVLMRQSHDPSKRAWVAGQIIANLKQFAPWLADKAISSILEIDDSQEMIELCYREAPDGSAAHQLTISYMVNSIADMIEGEYHDD